MLHGAPRQDMATYATLDALAASAASVPTVAEACIRKARATTATDGTYTWTYATPFAVGVVPVVAGIAEPVFGSTDVINVQIDGAPTNAAAKFRVTRTQRSAVALIGLTVLSIPASPGAIPLHLIAVAP